MTGFVGIATNLFSGGTGGGGGAGATASEAAVISANAGSIATLNASQAAQDALIAVMPTQAQVDAIQAVQDAEDPYKTFDRQPDGSINWTRESNATGTIAAPAASAGVVDTAITATGTNPVDGATIFASQAAQDTALAAKADQVALDAEIAATDAEQAAQDTAIAAKADQAALDAEIASTDAEQTAQDAAIALKADQTALDAEIASTDAEQTAQDAAIALKADQAALDAEIASTDAEQTAQDAAIALKADQSALQEYVKKSDVIPTAGTGPETFSDVYENVSNTNPVNKKFTPTATGTYRFIAQTWYFTSSNFILQVGTGGAGTTDVFDGDSDRLGTSSIIKKWEIPLTAGQTYDVRLLGGGGSPNRDFRLDINPL